MGDPGRLRQVMTNLLTNSIKFTAEGSVSLIVKVFRETAEVLEVHFSVEDTGIGIEEEVRKKLFRPFAQGDSSTHRRFGGTGLGLTISKNLVELMHGEISLTSKLGAGTVASFSIPFRKAPYQGDSSAERAPSIPDRLQSELSISRPGSDHSDRSASNATYKVVHHRGSSLPSIQGIANSGKALETLTDEERKAINVLVVEDNAVNQQIALKTIKKLGFPAQAVWNGKEALEYLEYPSPERPRPDVILMDVQMPIMDGYHATYTIRNSFSHAPEIQRTPIVAMTASAIQGDREKCESAGMDDYLAKPVKKTHLESMLVKWAVEGRLRKQAQRAQNPENASQVPARPAASRQQSSTLPTESASQDELSSQLVRLEYAQNAAVARSSETANETNQREQQQEEKAIALRTDVLMESGADPRTRLGRNLSEEGREQNQEEQKSLTTENMQMLAAKNRAVTLKTEHSELQDEVSSVGGINGDESVGDLSRVVTAPREGTSGQSSKRGSASTG